MKKKAKKKEGWERRIEQSICQRWKERRLRAEAIDDENPVEDDTLLRKNYEYERSVTIYTGNNIEVQRRKQDLLYMNIMKETLKSSSCGTLLLPSVSVPDEKHESAKKILSKLSVSTLSGVDSVSVVSYIQNMQEKNRDALCLAQHYRDMAERFKKEKLEATQKINAEVEVVRNFWRNNIKEGRTRAGKMVQKALMRRT